MLNNISFKIMRELCHDGRYSNVKLAQKLGISAVTVSKKINAMIEEGMISIKAMPNPAKMGYHAQVFIGLRVDLDKIQSVCKKLVDNNHVNMVANSFGRFDVLLIAFFFDYRMLQNFIGEELSKIEGINHIDTYMILEDNRYSKKIFPDSSTESEITLIDEVDQKIIQALIRNGRPNYAALANKLGISKSTLSRRIALLLEESIIKILAIPDYSKMGYSANACILISVELPKIDNIFDQLASYTEVHLVMRLISSSEFDILVGVYSANPGTLFKFLESKVGNIDGILKTETFIHGNFHYFRTTSVLPAVNRQGKWDS